MEESYRFIYVVRMEADKLREGKLVFRQSQSPTILMLRAEEEGWEHNEG